MKELWPLEENKYQVENYCLINYFCAGYLSNPIGVTCPEDETGGKYITGGSFTLVWPASSLGEATLHCPCGDTFSSTLTASRNCSWDNLNNQAVWDDADNLVCESMSINLCFNTMVCHYFHPCNCCCCCFQA